jgi:ketosteroid isomerase-like protein
MKLLSLSRIALGLSFVLAAVAAPASGADAAKEVAAIQAVDEVFVKAYNSGDLATVLAQYDEHAILQAPGVPVASGKAAIRTFFASDIPEAAKAGAKFVLNPGATGGVSGDLGWSSGTFLIKGKDGQILDKGKYLSVSRKVDGKWLYIRDTWNSDEAPPAAAPAVPAKK